MPFEVNLSGFASRTIFEDLVKDHIAKLTAFTKEVGKPRPVSHPLIEASIKRVQNVNLPDRYVEDYIIVTDPAAVKPEITLEDKKVKLHQAVVAAENEAKYKILPQRKMRLAILKNQLASAKLEDDRTAEESEDIASYLHVQKIWRGFELVGAQAESDIDDLNEHTVDSWQPPKFY